MDREYKETLYGSMFDELDRLQANRLHRDSEMQKLALNVPNLARGAQKGLTSLFSNPKAFGANIRRAYQAKAPVGVSGVPRRIGNVLRTNEGKALAAGLGGVAGLGGAGYMAGRIADR